MCAFRYATHCTTCYSIYIYIFVFVITYFSTCVYLTTSNICYTELANLVCKILTALYPKASLKRLQQTTCDEGVIFGLLSYDTTILGVLN